ncbi:carcinoembryonic antigen-related cell adhesion molecule 20-like [Cyprinus carpio]|uniref:Carcinoembryonic antigen-related cell adhesion molecule 20-like n=1 Tax=Cyprinus carpio TaxID=7962 RepID=A0A9Q9XNP5_CYPCA|nr:carcinoembryonic antigen-related cell adhesion molecule 20-like [Cyprinus carpio]
MGAANADEHLFIRIRICFLSGKVIMKLIFNALAVTLFLPYHVAFDKVSVSLMEGDSVTLHTGVETNQQEDIKWYFSGTRIAQINRDLSDICTDVQCNAGTERFRDRLKLDHQTGSLTIMNITNTDSGDYKLKTFNNDSEKIFSVSVTEVPAAELHEMKERESVTLDSGVIKHTNDVMTWYFNETEITGDQSEICTDVQCKERFRDRLKLDHQTGSLIIMNTRTTDSGDYKVLINIRNSSFSVTRVKRFSVSVTAVPDSDLSPAAVAGIVVAVILLVAAAVAAGVVNYRRRSRTAVPQNEEDDGNSPPDPKSIRLR